jgi:hypothetical protein
MTAIEHIGHVMSQLRWVCVERPEMDDDLSK